MEETLLSKLRKVQRLAERGVAGEREAALTVLGELLQKYNLTLEDLEVTETQPYDFGYRSRHDQTLLLQIYAKVVGVKDITYRKYQGRRKLIFELTPMQYADIKHLYDYYRPKLREEMRTLAMAFCHKHGLVAPASDEDYFATDLDEAWRILAYEGSLKDIAPPTRNGKRLKSGRGKKKSS